MAARKADSKQDAKKPRLDPAPDVQSDNASESELFTESKYSDDVELKFDNGKSLFVSKSFLSYASPYFERMFKSDCKENNRNTVEMKKKDYDAFRDMLLFLYPREQKLVSVQNAELVYAMADYYQIPTAKKHARTLLIAQIFSRTDGLSRYEAQDIETFIEETIELIMFAQTYEDQLLISALAERLSILPTETVMKNSHYEEIADTSKVKHLKFRLQRCNENNYSSSNKIKLPEEEERHDEESANLIRRYNLHD